LRDELDAMVEELSAATGRYGDDGGVAGANGGGSAATKPATGMRRWIVNETGLPACLELLQPASATGAGPGVAGVAVYGWLTKPRAEINRTMAKGVTKI
jgi:hypothetical protein